MKAYLLLLTSFLFTFSLSAQNCPIGGGPGPGPSGSSGQSLVAGGQSSFFNSNLNQAASQMLGQVNSSTHTGVAYSSIKGSPYLSKEKVNGSIQLNDGTIYTDLKMNIDLFTNDIIVENAKGEDKYLEKAYCQEIVLDLEEGPTTFRRVNPNKPDVFFEVLYEGDIVFYKDRDVKLREGENFGLSEVEPKFQSYTNYYIKNVTEDIAKVKLKKSEVFAQFPELEVIVMNEYIKKKGIKLKKESDYVEMFASVYE